MPNRKQPTPKPSNEQKMKQTPEESSQTVQDKVFDNDEGSCQRGKSTDSHLNVIDKKVDRISY